MGIQLENLDFTALKAKRVVDATPSGAGVFCDAMEEVGVSFLKVAQNFLLRSILDSANPVVFFVQHGQLTGLGRIVDPKFSSWGKTELCQVLDVDAITLSGKFNNC